MEKITLAGVEYELPVINFGGVRKLSKLGFNFNSIEEMEQNKFEFMSIMVAFITNKTLEEADDIIENSYNNADELIELIEKLAQYFRESDFFKKMQAESKKPTQKK